MLFCDGNITAGENCGVYVLTSKAALPTIAPRGRSCENYHPRGGAISNNAERRRHHLFVRCRRDRASPGNRCERVGFAVCTNTGGGGWLFAKRARQCADGRFALGKNNVVVKFWRGARWPSGHDVRHSN